MRSIHLDKEEKELSDSYDRGEWRSVKNLKAESQKLRIAAKNTLKKDARINIRLSSKDLGDIQVIAAREGLPYQTLLSSVIHKYASGLLTEK
jgi:predicted DNA binding CopG/RHH family protein